MSTTVTPVAGVFEDRPSAERAWQSIEARGYTRDDVHLMMSEETRRREFPPPGDAEDDDARARQTELSNKAAEGAGIGGAIGGGLGAIAAAVAAVGTTIALPGLGLVVAGPLAAAIAGAGAGAATGGIVGALVGWGIPDDHVEAVERGVRDGRIVMAVRPRNEEDRRHFAEAWRPRADPTDAR